jgi:hypothetical protein
MFRRFLEGADERLPCLAEAKINLSVHVVGMELNLSGLPNDVVHVQQDMEASSLGSFLARFFLINV